MNSTKISGVFSLESKHQKVSKSNMVVKNGITQLFDWFKLADYAQAIKHSPGEKLFSKNAVERLNWSLSDVSTDGANETIKNSFSNIEAIIDGWNNTSSFSNYSGSYLRKIKVSFKENEKGEGLNLKGIALYGKRVSNYESSSVSYSGSIILTRKFVLNDVSYVAKKIFETPVLMSPCSLDSDKLSFDEKSQYWAGGKYYVYFTFDEMFNNEKNWEFYDSNNSVIKLTEEELNSINFQKSITLETPYLKDICEIEITDAYNSTIQINELDIYTYRPNCFYNSPSFFKIGTGNTAVDISDVNLASAIEEKIMVEDIYLTDEGKIRYVGYIPEGKYNNINISEVGLFYKQDGVEELFAKTVLTEAFTIPKDSLVRIAYDLEVQ